MRIIVLNKPYGVVSQFSPSGAHPTLRDYVSVPAVYPAGRLDRDSEGLLLLTDDGALQHRITDPQHKLEKRYWAQVEGIPADAALRALRAGVVLQGERTRPATIDIIQGEPPGLWTRDPPIRHRKNIPTTWLGIGLREGRNRQVRHMTAAVGHPTLRLVRHAIGPWTLGTLQPGEYRIEECAALPGRPAPARRPRSAVQPLIESGRQPPRGSGVNPKINAPSTTRRGNR